MEEIKSKVSKELIGKIEHMLMYLISALRSSNMYPEGHSLTNHTLEKAFNEIDAVIDETGELTLLAVDGDLIFDNIPIGEDSAFIEGFLKELESKEIERITFQMGLRLKEFKGFIYTFSNIDPENIKNKSLEQYFQSKGIKHIIPGRLKKNNANDNVKKEIFEDEALRQLENEVKYIYTKGIKSLKKIHFSVINRKSPKFVRLKEFIREICLVIEHNPNVLSAFTTNPSNKYYPYNHMINTGIIAGLIGNSVGMERDLFFQTVFAAIVHDIGKFTYPDGFLQEPLKENSPAHIKMKYHPVIGTKLLRRAKGVSSLAVLAAYEHHLNLDGSGFPETSENIKPNAVSEIVSVANVYDNLQRTIKSDNQTSELIYKKLFNMSDRGLISKGFVKHLFHCLGVYPPGSFVQLNTGEIAKIIQINQKDILKPKVKIYKDPYGEKHEVPILADLESDKLGGRINRFVMNSYSKKFSNVKRKPKIKKKSHSQ